MSSKTTNAKKSQQLGVAHGTARNKLVKQIMFELVKETKKDLCFHCGEKIVDIKNFTIEHKIPWLDSKDPKGLYFLLDNIAFSHHSCNVSSARRKEGKPCPSSTAYHKGCRCEKCTKINSESNKKWRINNKENK